MRLIGLRMVKRLQHDQASSEHRAAGAPWRDGLNRCRAARQGLSLAIMVAASVVLAFGGSTREARAQFGGTGGRSGGVGGAGGFGGAGFGGGFGNTGFGNIGFNTAGTGQSQGFTANLNGNNVFGPTQANPFRNYYLNPNSLGNRPISGSTGTLANRTAQGSFGQPVFPVTATSAASGGFGTAGSTTTGGLTGGGRGTTTGGVTGGSRGTTTAGFGGTAATGARTGSTFAGSGTGRTAGLGGATTGRTTAGLGSGFGTTGVGGFGISGGLGTGIAGTGGVTGVGGFSGASGVGFARPSQRSTGYVARLSPILQPRLTPPSQLRARVQSALRSSSLAPLASKVSVDTSGDELVLRGTVSSAREARKVEAYIRLTPGVRAVRNELKVAK